MLISNKNGFEYSKESVLKPSRATCICLLKKVGNESKMQVFF